MSAPPTDLVAFLLDYFRAYDEHDVAAIVGMIGDPQVRHVAGETTTLTTADTTARIEHWFATYSSMHFEPVVLVADGNRISATWNATLTTAGGEAVLASSIEVFRVERGRIVEVWNAEPAFAHFLP
jgi:limonene-1,2-epoxide hydrolase